MPDTYVKLPSGQYVQIPEGATPDQLQQFKSKLVQMAGSPESQVPDATAQAKGVIGKMAQNMQPSFLGGAHATPEQNKQIDAAMVKMPQRVHDIRSAALSAGGASLGPEIGAMAQGLPKFIQMMATASGTGAGAGLGAFAGGTSPEESLKMAAGTTATGMVLSPLTRWLASSKSVGARALNAASQKAGNAPVELSSRTNELVDDIVKEGSSGGSPPKVVSDLLKRLGPAPGQAADAVPGPLNYNEARIFQSNLSQLSSTEQQSMNGRMGGLIKQLAKSFSGDVQTAANAAGAGPEHAIGMQEYAAASSRNRALAKGAKIVGLGGGGTVLAKALYEAGKMVGGSKR